MLTWTGLTTTTLVNLRAMIVTTTMLLTPVATAFLLVRLNQEVASLMLLVLVLLVLVLVLVLVLLVVLLVVVVDVDVAVRMGSREVTF
jgi:hypothetical protein